MEFYIKYEPKLFIVINGKDLKAGEVYFIINKISNTLDNEVDIYDLGGNSAYTLYILKENKIIGESNHKGYPVYFKGENFDNFYKEFKISYEDLLEKNNSINKEVMIKK